MLIAGHAMGYGGASITTPQADIAMRCCRGFDDDFTDDAARALYGRRRGRLISGR